MFQLEYPVTRPFPWRYFTHAALLIMTFAVIVIALFNVAAVGFDLQPFYTRTYAPTKRKWWTSDVRGREGCESRLLSVRDVFTTELGIFQYTIESIGTLSKNNPLGVQRLNDFSYNGTTLDDCTFHYLSLTVSRPDSTTALKGHVTCLTKEIQLNISSSLIMSPERDKDTIYSRFLSEGRTFTSALYSHEIISPVLLTLMGFSVDVLNVMYVVPPELRGFPVPSTRHMSYTYTPKPGARWNWTNETLFQSFDSGDLYPFMLEGETSLAVMTNLFHTFSSAVMVDLGSNATLFHAPDQFDTLLDTHFNETEARPTDLRWRWSPAEGIPRFETPFVTQFLQDRASFRINLPIKGVAPAVIDSSFFCKAWRLKPPFSLLTAVAAATISFALAIWAALMFLAEYFARRKQETPYIVLAEPFKV